MAAIGIISAALGLLAYSAPAHGVTGNTHLMNATFFMALDHDRSDDVLSFLQVHQSITSLGQQSAKQSGLVRGHVGQPDFWPLALGPPPVQSGSTYLLSPPDLNRAFSWSWHHPKGHYATTIAGGPVIDAGENLYFTANDGIRKLSPDGHTLWWYQAPGDTSNQPSLMGDAVLGNTGNGYAFALNQSTGRELWLKRLANRTGMDVGYPGGYDGVYVMAVDEGHVEFDGGNWRVIGVDAGVGDILWDYTVEWPTWNFMPIFMGDDTFLFMDFTGGAYRLGLRNGTEIWHRRSPGTVPGTNRFSFGDGGLSVGNNGIAYTCSNNGTGRGVEGGFGALRALSVNDGHYLWDHVLPQPCNSWPAVGPLGSGPELSVVVTPGSFMGTEVMHGGMMAFDAESGSLQWKWQADPYSHLGNMAMGDVEGAAMRAIHDPKHTICLPAHWSAPVIMGDGAILAGRCDGVIYKLRGPAAYEADVDVSKLTADYESSPGVIVEDTFNARGASLHGAIGVAPGMFAFATCTDSIFVFRY